MELMTASQSSHWSGFELESGALLELTCMVEEHAGRSLGTVSQLKYPLFPNIIHHFELHIYNII
jgi:hypothetical protein